MQKAIALFALAGLAMANNEDSLLIFGEADDYDLRQLVQTGNSGKFGALSQGTQKFGTLSRRDDDEDLFDDVLQLVRSGGTPLATPLQQTQAGLPRALVRSGGTPFATPLAQKQAGQPKSLVQTGSGSRFGTLGQGTQKFGTLSKRDDDEDLFDDVLQLVRSGGTPLATPLQQTQAGLPRALVRSGGTPFATPLEQKQTGQPKSLVQTGSGSRFGTLGQGTQKFGTLSKRDDDQDLVDDILQLVRSGGTPFATPLERRQPGEPRALVRSGGTPFATPLEKRQPGEPRKLIQSGNGGKFGTLGQGTQKFGITQSTKFAAGRAGSAGGRAGSAGGRAGSAGGRAGSGGAKRRDDYDDEFFSFDDMLLNF